MAAKVKWYREAWWVITHHACRTRKNRVGPTKADKRRAEQIAEKVNAAIALNQFNPRRDEQSRLIACDRELWAWHRAYKTTMKPSYEIVTEGLIRLHLVPFFGSVDLRMIEERDLLRFAQEKLDAGLSPKTIKNALSILRRVYNL